MSNLITVQELKDSIGEMLPSNYSSNDAEFISFVNRSAKRLVKKAPVPHLVVEVDFTVTIDAQSPEGSCILDTNLYDHVIAFRDPENGNTYEISPLNDQYLDSVVSRQNFTDRGYLPNYTGNRYYERPRNRDDLVGKTIKGLVKSSYLKVDQMTDLLPFDHTGGIKLALAAVFFEDKGDSASSEEYWQKAINEETESAIQYRGPVYPVIKFYGNEAHNVTQAPV